MPRINPNSYATKAVAISDASSDELVRLEDAVTQAQKALAAYLHAHPVERQRIARIRDTAPMARDNRPFSIFAPEDPRPAA